jgi:hypothetical protein
VSVEELFASVSSRMLADDRRVEQGPIMRSTGLKLRGRFFAFARHGELVVKLPAARVRELVESGEGGAFVGSRERVMREWVVLRPADDDACARYVAEAKAFAEG